MVNNAKENTIEFGLILEPIPAHKGHAHGPETPTEKRNGLELALGKVPAISKHPSTLGERLNHVKVGPCYVVGNDDG